LPPSISASAPASICPRGSRKLGGRRRHSKSMTVSVQPNHFISLVAIEGDHSAAEPAVHLSLATNSKEAVLQGRERPLDVWATCEFGVRAWPPGTMDVPKLPLSLLRTAGCERGTFSASTVRASTPTPDGAPIRSSPQASGCLPPRLSRHSLNS